MAHDLDFSKGKAAFASYKKVAWHRLGTILEQRPESVEKILALSGLDYEVEKLPNIHRLADGTEMTSKDSFFTYRTDVNKIMGDHVGSRYTIMQNVEAMGVLEPFIDDQRILFESAGALKEGRWTFVCLKFADPMRIGKGDVVENYITIWNSFDGSKALTAMISPIRVVCNNTLQMAVEGSKKIISIRHTQNMGNRLDEAMRILHTFEHSQELFAENAKVMRKDNWGKSKFMDYLANVFCSPSEIRSLNQGKHPFEALSTRKTNIIGEVMDFAHGGVGQAEAESGSAWWAYSAVTGYYSNVKTFTSDEKKAESILFGGADATMTKALKMASKPGLLTPIGVSLN